MKRQSQKLSSLLLLSTLVAGALLSTGCTANFYTLRREGQSAMLRGDVGPAKYFFIEAEKRKPRHAGNLHDLGVCCVILARDRFSQMNHAAAFDQLDRAVGYYRAALDVQPGNQAAREGLSTALELKGQFDEALNEAQWAAKFVGPSAKQHIFLARKLEERGDVDAALLRYRQAVAMEPSNPKAHVAISEFLLRHDNEVAAIHHLQAAYKLDPRDPWVAEQLAARGAMPLPAQQALGSQ